MRELKQALRSSLVPRLLGFAMLVAALLIGASRSEARLHPYYVLTGLGTGTISPRILFVLDTSGSMAWRAQASPEDCSWNSCEDGTGSAQSRIAAAREAINGVITATEDRAKFAFMTFDQETPPTNNAPSMCDGDRFVWLDRYVDNENHDIEAYYGYDGHWQLCDDDDNQPYPFLRWNNLGRVPKVTANNQTGAIPASPLISTTSSNMKHSSNADRKVQWFSSFPGVRFNLNCNDSTQLQIMRDSVGDYGSSNNGSSGTTKRNNICGQDFYYWPYVDGFPGYSRQTGWLDSSCDRRGCDVVATLGVVKDQNVEQAHLYVPFYIDVDPADLNPNYTGPVSEEAAKQDILRLTRPLIEGGVDAGGGTPWTDVIGTIPAAPIRSNAIFSHTTVGSYLKFTQNIESADVCAPTAAVLITDGQPDCINDNSGCDKLYKRLADLRRDLNVRVYVVGFFLSSDELHEMACAGAGACDGNNCESPCNDEPVADWDTCSDSTDPEDGCAFLSNSTEELAAVLTDIIAGTLDTSVSSGPGTSLNDFGSGSASGSAGSDNDPLQTKVNAWTDYPGWKGHVTREICTDTIVDDQGQTVTAPWCIPDPNDPYAEADGDFGPCDPSWEWDAGECLQATDWKDRRVYTNNSANQLVRISDSAGRATSQFVTQLSQLGLVSGLGQQAQADAIVEFILGKDWPDGWKLPGLANSAPVVVRRIPEYDEMLLPSVPIRDPHCAGRVLTDEINQDIPQQLKDFAEDSWASMVSDHHEYQEAVLIGDDLGMMHAFQLNTGNELWGYIPRFLLAKAVEQSQIGADKVGQPDKIEDHVYGLSATINHGWIYDSALDAFRHLGVVGVGAGGYEYLALELSHMAPDSPLGPFEIAWTSEDTALKADYDRYNGETWARPALTYELTNNQLTDLPRSYVVMGSGYQSSPATHTDQGRTLMLANATTGALVETALLPTLTTPVYEANFGALVDTTVATHCLSRFWGEMQETYVADPAGRLFRWDLGDNRSHAADSVSAWNGAAKPVFRFPACQGTGTTCTVSAANKGDVFVYAPAVTANNRIDDDGFAPGALDKGSDQFLVAMISGSPFEDTLADGDSPTDFHSSLYLLVDDHRGANASTGFNIPTGAPKMTTNQVGQANSNANYLRLALSDITRTRCVRYPNNPNTLDCSDVARFSKNTRPIRAPRILVKGVAQDENGQLEAVPGAEVVDISFLVYEPPVSQCDARWYNSTTKEWSVDEGSTFEITLSLTVKDDAGFNFATGYSNASDPADNPFGASYQRRLQMGAPSQVMTDGCADGSCGPVAGSPGVRPCEQEDPGGSGTQEFAVPVLYNELVGFSPVE